MKLDWKKYLLAFFITTAIFGTAFYLASRFNAERIANIQTTENQISIDILSSETEYDLLGQLDCSEIAKNQVLSDELNSLANRLSYAENTLGAEDPQVRALKEQYSLLEIKDYILLQKVATQCGLHPSYILYFYSNTGDCADCSREGDVLTYLRQTYPSLRVYSFDYHLDLSAITALIDIRNINGSLPILVVDNHKPLYGFKSVSNIFSLAPEIEKLASTSSASSTQSQ